MYQRTIQAELTKYHYNNKTWLYNFMNAFIFGFVQDNDYYYDIKPTKKINIFPITSYSYDTFSVLNTDYDYFCGDMNKLSLQNGCCSVSAASSGVFWKHTATELETGFDYFGARYYMSDLSIWLSVDPLSDMYPSVSSYMYVLGNPILYVDKKGESPIVSGLIGGAIGVGVKYIHKRFIKKEEFTWEDAAVGFAGGFMVGSGAALIGAMGYSTTTAIMMNGVNGALSLGFENSMEAAINNRGIDYSEFFSDVTIGLITGMAGGAVTEGLSAFVNKIGDKTISQLTKKEYKQYLKGQTKQFKKQLKAYGYKSSGKSFKRQLNKLLQNSRDVKISEIEGVRAGVTKTTQGTSQITLTELNLISDDKIK